MSALPSSIGEYAWQSVAEFPINNITYFLLWFGIIYLVLLLLPLLFYLTASYIAILLLLFYKYRYKLNKPYENPVWDSTRDFFCELSSTMGRFWHGYDVVGLENLPTTKRQGVLMVMYHGTFPIEALYLMAHIWKERKLAIKTVVNRGFWKVPGLSHIIGIFHAIVGNYEECLEYLREGHVILVLPGGMMEALFGDSNYRLVWGKRSGFARLAMEAKVPIIPVFTENTREVYRIPSFGKEWFRSMYEKSKIPIYPMFGGLPVKLRTHIGEPISYDPNLTVEMLRAKICESVENLIEKNQLIPGNMFWALVDRFTSNEKKEFQNKKDI